MLSSIEHDKHYQIYNSSELTTSIPYKLHNFGINVIEYAVNNA
jgi:hypothetical protein